jgi:hypothetical protein
MVVSLLHVQARCDVRDVWFATSEAKKGRRTAQHAQSTRRFKGRFPTSRSNCLHPLIQHHPHIHPSYGSSMNFFHVPLIGCPSTDASGGLSAKEFTPTQSSLAEWSLSTRRNPPMQALTSGRNLLFRHEAKFNCLPSTVLWSNNPIFGKVIFLDL